MVINILRVYWVCTAIGIEKGIELMIRRKSCAGWERLATRN